ncbi:MAG: BatD family protein [Candidatus Hydrogenedentes bacterium]|nr:BatD family protein [Candidatus Hydrogenedentota bacterium]
MPLRSTAAACSRRSAWGLIFVVLAHYQCATAQVAEPASEDAADPGPMIEDAVYIDARVDRDSVYLGEAITLTLEYGELELRGVRVQPRERIAGLRLPSAEGFYTGGLTVEHTTTARDGALYSVTLHHQRLYPARAGELTIGAWAWTGSARGYTSTGVSAADLDLATAPIRVRVRPLPPPPDGFQGAVGELELEMAFESHEMRQGVPVTVSVILSGTGNPESALPPEMPAASWYRIGNPVEEPAPGGGDDGVFSRRFRYEFMPVGAGSRQFPPVVYPYFSPAEGRYRIARTPPLSIEIAPSGEADALVVIGGSGDGATSALEVVREGRMPIVTHLERVRVRRDRIRIWPLAITFPPVGFALWILWAWRGGLTTRSWRGRRRTPGEGVRIAAALADPHPADALRAALRDILSERTGVALAGMTVTEMRSALAGGDGEDAAGELMSLLEACDRARYAGDNATLEGLGDRARAALGSEARSGWWRCAR